MVTVGNRTNGTKGTSTRARSSATIDLFPPWRKPAWDEVMVIALYERPKDWPLFYVLRAFYSQLGPKVTPAQGCVFFPTLEGAQAWVNKTYPRTKFLDRSVHDEPQLMGVWI